MPEKNMPATSDEQTNSERGSSPQIALRDPDWRSRVLGWLRAAQAPVLSILGGLAIGALIIVLTGENPVSGYAELFRGAFSTYNLPSTLNRAVPIVGCGLAVLIAFRSGLINLGIEGQFVLGGLAGAWVAVSLPVPDYFRLPVALLAGVLAGGLYALSSAWFWNSLISSHIKFHLTQLWFGTGSNPNLIL